MSTLRGFTGNAVPRSWPTHAPHERSAAERDSIASRPPPPPSPQPWRDWSGEERGKASQGGKLGDTTWHEGYTRPDNPPPLAEVPPVRRRRRRALASFTFLLLGALVGLVVVLTHRSPDARADQSPPSSASVPRPTTPGPQRERIPYPGYSASDVIANSAGVAVIRGVTAKLHDATISTDVFGQETLCASVSLQNGSPSQLNYDSENWGIQSPTGDVQQPSLVDSSEDLSDGQLIPGGTVSGKLCFDDPGQAGVYIVSFRPELGVNPSGRVVWAVRQQ